MAKNSNEALIELLKTDFRFVDDEGELAKAAKGLDKQKKLLAELLNKNQLYVNLSEIDDKDFNVSEEDKKLNRSFYSGGI